MKPPKELLFKCQCGSPHCGKLLAVLFDDGLIELNWVKHRRKKASEGVIVKIKEFEKFLKIVCRR